VGGGRATSDVEYFLLDNAVILADGQLCGLSYCVTNVALHLRSTLAALSGGAIVTREGRDPPFAGLGRAGPLAREIERDPCLQGEGPPQT
jgi:hypothetical protein